MKKSLILKIEETITGFTLAEVLITLTIIGVIAALTIPALIQSIQDAQYRTAWKKEFSVLNQAALRALSDNAGSFKGVTSTFYHDRLKNAFIKYMSVSKICYSDPVPRTTYGNCWTYQGSTSEADIGVTKFLNGNNVYTNIVPLGAPAGVILSDGSFVLFSYQDNSCTSSNPLFNAYQGVNVNEGLNNLCGWITVDVNGPNGPNIVGKDIFGAWVAENGIVPYGIKNLSNTCNSSSTGLGCSAQYLKQ